MPNPLIGLIGSTVGSVVSAGIQGNAAKSAANMQAQAADKARELVMPFVTAGEGALGGMQALLGLSGNEAQASAIQNLSDSPEMQALVSQGENALLQNAAATGGLRGGNTQGALAQYRPAMLSNLINQRYSQLGQVATMGQNASVQAGTNLQQAGAAMAGGKLAGATALGQGINAITSGVGSYYGSFGGANPSPYQVPDDAKWYGNWGGGF
jgi:hypothetical protein